MLEFISSDCTEIVYNEHLEGRRAKRPMKLYHRVTKSSMDYSTGKMTIRETMIIDFETERFYCGS